MFNSIVELYRREIWNVTRKTLNEMKETKEERCFYLVIAGIMIAMAICSIVFGYLRPNWPFLVFLYWCAAPGLGVAIIVQEKRKRKREKIQCVNVHEQEYMQKQRAKLMKKFMDKILKKKHKKEYIDWLLKKCDEEIKKATRGEEIMVMITGWPLQCSFLLYGGVADVLIQKSWYWIPVLLMVILGVFGIQMNVKGFISIFSSNSKKKVLEGFKQDLEIMLIYYKK